MHFMGKKSLFFMFGMWVNFIIKMLHSQHREIVSWKKKGELQLTEIIVDEVEAPMTSQMETN